VNTFLPAARRSRADERGDHFLHHPADSHEAIGRAGDRDDVSREDQRRDGEPLCLIGDSGTGKSHLLIGLGTAAAEAGFRVKYTLATKLVNELVEAADEKVLAKTIARYGRVDLICIDELGYMELDRRGAELLFQVLTEREEKNSVAIASNDSFVDENVHRPALVCGYCRSTYFRQQHH